MNKDAIIKDLTMQRDGLIAAMREIAICTLDDTVDGMSEKGARIALKLARLAAKEAIAEFATDRAAIAKAKP